MYTILWEYTVKPDCVETFEENYGPSGTWAQFFRMSEDYVRTDLFRSACGKHRYLTIDHWTSKEAYESFTADQAQEYSRIDAQCDSLTESETKIGTFVSLK